MTHSRLFVLPFLFAALTAFPACAPTADEEQVEQDEGELKKLPAASVIGSLAYGETKEVTVATATYRALSFKGKAGDEVNANLLASAAKLDGLWITTSTFATLAAVNAVPGTAALSATTKLPADGTYYLVFRQRTSAAITHKITLTNVLTKPDVGLTLTAIATESDGLAKVRFPGSMGDRFRIVLRPANALVPKFSVARVVGCANQEMGMGNDEYTWADVTVTSTATCTLQVGPRERAGAGLMYMAAIVRLDDPERAAYLKSLECEGPGLPLSSLAAAMPEATSRLPLTPRGAQRGRQRSCNPATGCSPYRPLPITHWTYTLFATDAGLKFSVTDEQGTAFPSPIDRTGENYTVKVAPGCLSLTSDAPDANGSDHVVRFDLTAAPRTPNVEPPFSPTCAGAPLTEAQMAGLFAPGTSERDFDLPTQGVARACNRLSACAPWGLVRSSTTALSFRIDGQGKTSAHWGMGWQPMQGGQIMLNGVSIGKVTASCIDLTHDVEHPSGADDGSYSNTRSRKVGTR